MSDSSSDSSWPSLAWSNIPIDRYKPDPPRKKGPTFWNSHQLVTLFAGQNKEAKSFLIHKDFACHYSPVLKAALNSNFIEGQTQSYRMEEDNHEAVHLLIHWFYTQVLDTQQPKERLTGKPKDNEDLALIQLWILADKLLIPELQNLVTGRIDSIRRITQAIPTGCLQSVYKDTSAGSPLRRWFVHQCAAQGSRIGLPSTLKTSRMRCSSILRLCGAGRCRRQRNSDLWRRLISLISRLRIQSNGDLGQERWCT